MGDKNITEGAKRIKEFLQKLPLKDAIEVLRSVETDLREGEHRLIYVVADGNKEYNGQIQTN